MSMDQRQTQIKERAGLDESKINQEFVEMLTKWGPYALFAFAAIAGIYFLINYREKAAADTMDRAFVEYDAASVTRSPSSLLSVAEGYPSQGAVPHLARLAAADVHLEAFRTGVPVGEHTDDKGNLAADKALLTNEQRQAELKTGETLYLAVFNGTNNNDGQLLVTLAALNGLAAIAECTGDTEHAKGYYQQVVDKAKAAKFDGLADAAKKRIDSLGTLAEAPKLYAKADLPAEPEQPTIMSGGMTGLTADGKRIPLGGTPTITGSDGKPIQLQPMPAGFDPTKVPQTPAPAPAPAPTPAPAPAP